MSGAHGTGSCKVERKQETNEWQGQQSAGPWLAGGRAGARSFAHRLASVWLLAGSVSRPGHVLPNHLQLAKLESLHLLNVYRIRFPAAPPTGRSLASVNAGPTMMALRRLPLD